jgi:hypothetical protein
VADDETVAKHQAIKLDAWPRAGIAGMGLLGIAAGAVATFTRDVEAGPVAMLALGAFFFLMGMVGYLPTRLKIGENEAEWSAAVEEVLERVIEEVPASSLPEVAQAIEEFSVRAPAIANATRQGFEEEQRLVRATEVVAQSLGLSTAQPDIRLSNGARPDLVVTSGSRKLWVITQARPVKGWEKAAATANVGTMKAEFPDFVGLMLLYRPRDEFDNMVRQDVQPEVSIWFTPVHGRTARDQIKTALLDVFPAHRIPR